jgi:hypothetical protein
MIKSRGSRVEGRGPASPIGRKLVLRLSDGAQYVGTVLDAAGKKAKRVRIQSPGAKQGAVVMPTEYVVLEYI